MRVRPVLKNCTLFFLWCSIASITFNTKAQQCASSDSWQNACGTVRNRCGANGRCKLLVTLNGGAVTVTGPYANTPICIDRGKSIRWTAADTNDEIILVFPTMKHSPL